MKDGAIWFYSNLHAPTGKRIIMNECNQGALGIPKFRSPAAMDFLRKPSCARPAGAPGIPEFSSPDGDATFKVIVMIKHFLEEADSRPSLSYPVTSFQLFCRLKRQGGIPGNRPVR